MTEPETMLAQAERHVREGMERVTRQAAIVDRLEKNGRWEAAHEARKLLSALIESLRLAREGLQREREAAGSKP